MKKTNEHTKFHLLLLIIIASAIIFFRYDAIFKNFNTNKTSDIYRDGIKTVLNATYHAKYSDSYTWFGGMNYPYEEHIVAATELPGLAILFKFLHPYFPWVTEHAFGIVHLFLLGSILLGCVFIYLIFKELKVPWLLAIPFSIAIAFLAPQNMRFTVHMGLAPVFILPSILYYLLRLEKTGHWKNAVYLSLFTFISAFTHFYFFAIIAIFVSLYFGILFLEKIFFSESNSKKLINSSFNKKWFFKNSLHYFIAIGIPLIFFLYWMILNDPVSDRTPNPYGFFVYHSNFTNIFSSPHLPLFEGLDKRWFDGNKVDFEGWSYIGLIADLFFIFILLKWLISLFRKNLFHFFPSQVRPFLYRILFAGSIMAYLSCSQPFIQEGWEYLLQYTGPYKQFRSTGRFAWAFYFSINIIAFTGFYYLIKILNNKILKTALFVLIIGISFYEAYTFHTNGLVYREYKLRYAPELEPQKEFTTITDIDFTKYQAIIPSPLFLVGSNNVEVPGSAYIIQQALVLSNQTGLPVTGAMLTRSSHSQSLHQLQLVTEPYRLPELLKNVKNKKPFILLESITDKKKYEVRYGHLKVGATLLHETERWRLYEIPFNNFETRINNKIEKINKEAGADSLFQINQFLSTDSIENFIYQNFDHIPNPAENSYFSKGNYKGIIGRDNFLFIDTLPNATTEEDYHLQLWVNIKPDKFASANIKITEKWPDGQSFVIGQTTPGWGWSVFDADGWVMLEIPFRVSNPKSELTVSFKNYEDYDLREMTVDELLIKPMKTDLYQQTNQFIWKNNQHW